MHLFLGSRYNNGGYTVVSESQKVLSKTEVNLSRQDEGIERFRLVRHRGKAGLSPKPTPAR